MNNRRVLIAGASIAGPTLAFWLAKFGFKPTVAERAPSLRQGGNGVDVRLQAIQVAERMGILEQVRRRRVETKGIRFVSADDQLKGEIDLTEIQNKSSSPGIEILRGDLAAILYEKSRNAVEYMFGASIEAVKQDADGVDVEFTSGRTSRFDLLFGADGFHSAVRRSIFGPERQHVHFLEHYFASAEIPYRLGPENWTTLYNEPGKLAGVTRSHGSEKAQALFMFRQAQSLTYDYRNIDQQKRALCDSFAGSAWNVPNLLSHAIDDPNFISTHSAK